MLAVCHVMRYFPPCVKIKEIIDSGKIGKLFLTTWISGELWGTLGISGDLWGSLGISGELWGVREDWLILMEESYC